MELNQVILDNYVLYNVLFNVCANLTGVNQDLTFEPYHQFQRILAGNPVGTNVGDSLRMEAFTIGVIHHLLQCLSIAGHHPSRCREKVMMLIKLCLY